MREYTVGDRPITELAEGMTVNVTLYPSFSVTAQDGCYVIRDHVPLRSVTFSYACVRSVRRCS